MTVRRASGTSEDDESVMRARMKGTTVSNETTRKRMKEVPVATTAWRRAEAFVDEEYEAYG